MREKRILLPFLYAAVFVVAVTARAAAVDDQEHILTATQTKIIQEALARGDGGHYKYTVISDSKVIGCLLYIPRVRSLESSTSVGVGAVHFQNNKPCQVAVKMRIHALSWRPMKIPRVGGCIISAENLKTHQRKFRGEMQSVSSVSGSNLLAQFSGCKVSLELIASHQLTRPPPWAQGQSLRFQKKMNCFAGEGNDRYQVPCGPYVLPD